MPAPAHPPVVATLTATGLSRDRGAHTVLRGVSVTIAPGTRMGVVGPNGVGKSTLLQILAGKEPADAGHVELRPRSATIGYLAQQHERRSDETVRALLHRRTGVMAAEAEMVAAADALGAGAPGAADTYTEALERWSALGADDLDARIDSVLFDVGLGPELADRTTSALSGGQMARVELASVLLSRFDLTLLDEPTNDLDFDGLARLESFVRSRQGGLVIVSHDRDFLERTITSVLELDDHDHTSRLYSGGYAAFLEERSTARRHAQEAYATYRAQRKELLDRAQRERQWATSGVGREKRRPRDNDKAQRDFRINRTERLAARARMTERAMDRLEQVDKPWEGWDLRFAIEEAPRAGAVALRLEEAVIGRGDFRLGPLDLEIAWGERVAITGPNGSGKTTLLETLLGRLPLIGGRRYVGPSVVVGELGQDRAAFSDQARLLDAFQRFSGQTVAEVRSLLAKFGIGADHVDRAVSTLSPGERTRVELAGFQARHVNLLVLDEPTNHLDLPAIEQLEEALAGFGGTLLVVSHDRRLLESVELSRRIEMGELGA